jgi:putative acetyltransferase
MPLTIRPAVAADAEALLRVHSAAVRETAASWYPGEVIEAWAAEVTEASCEMVRLDIEDPATVVLVAEADSEVVGFTVIIPANEELRMLYVQPEHGRRGIGTAMLNQLETLAIARGVRRLHLGASLNAEVFYRKHGYQAIENGIHRLPTGQEMACVKMVKDLC